MNKFLTFETTSLKLNGLTFPSDSASFDLRTDLSNVYDIDGNFLYLSPNSPIQGQVTSQFFLTGAFPDFLKIENQSETPTKIQFNNFFIPSAHLTDLSFAVSPFQPVLVSVGFVFYHGLSVLDTSLKSVNNDYNETLGTINGLSSYLVTYDRDTYLENPNNFLITNFSYSFNVERQPVLRIKETVPSRIALKQISCDLNLEANNLDGRLKINGNNASMPIYLRDSHNPSISTLIDFAGTIVDQSYSISNNNVGLSKIKINKILNKSRVLLNIPFEEEDYALIYATPTAVNDLPIPIPDIPSAPPNPPVIIVNGNIEEENSYQVTVLFKFPFTSTNGSTPTQPCNDAHAYSTPLISISSFNINGFRFSFSPKQEDTKFITIPSSDQISSLSEYDKQYQPPQYYVGTISFNQKFLDYLNSEISYTESFPTIVATDDYGNSENVVMYLFSHSFNLSEENQCVANPRVIHYMTWDNLFSALSNALGDPNLGNGLNKPYIVKFGYGG